MKSIRIAGPLALALVLGLAGASAAPVFFRGGKSNLPGITGGGGGGTSHACDSLGTGVCADFANGQSFVTWPDRATGSAGAAYRYRVYRSNAPLSAGNYTSSTLIASYVFNNSGQLFGGNPDTGGANFTQTNRQSATLPMAKIPDATASPGTLKQLTYGTGLQIYTALATQVAYYAVVSTTTTDGSPAYIGSVGPVAESAAPQKGLLYAHRTTGNYRIVSSTTGLPMVFQAHASSSSGGATANSSLGDYWEWFGNTSQGYQDGRATVFGALRDGVGGAQYPNLANSIVITNRDTVWSPDGLGSMETYHFGQGYTPNPLVGPANRYYPVTQNALASFIKFAASNYGGDLNRLHWSGQSMGAWAGALVGLRLPDPKFASIWATFPVWRQYQHGCALLAGYTLWTATMPFRATVAAPPCTMGTNPAAVLLPDGSSWIAYEDTTTYAATHPEVDLPFIAWVIGKDDSNFTPDPPTNFIEDVQAVAGFQAGHQAHAFAWDMGHHDSTAMGAINKDSSGADSAAYSKTQFALNVPVIAFDNSSIDDDPGTGTRDDITNIYDGDVVGCVNCGFSWNVTSDTSGAFNFTVGNSWMARAATVIPTTTLSASMPSSGTGSFAVGSTISFLGISTNNTYVRIGDEIVQINSKTSNAIFITLRGALGTTARAHSPGETVTQYPSQPTGPNVGPQSTMTVNVTPRRRQGFKPANGVTVTCSITPFGGSPTTQTPTVAGGIFTLMAVPIKSTGSTSVACS